MIVQIIKKRKHRPKKKQFSLCEKLLDDLYTDGVSS